MTGPVHPGPPPLHSDIKTMNSDYALDKSNARMLGVCAGLARSTGWDPLLIRLGAVALTLFLLGPLMLVAYAAAAILAESR